VLSKIQVGFIFHDSGFCEDCAGLFQIEVIGDNNMASTLAEQEAHLLVSNHVNGHLDGFILMAL
jgi:hypothetical protein